MTIEAFVRNLAQGAKAAADALSFATTAAKNQALTTTASLIVAREQELLAANAKDLDAARQQNYAGALIDRLTLTSQGIAAMAAGLRTVASLPDPVGEISTLSTQSSGIRVGKMRVPLGVVAMIYEARPNVTADAAALCLKSGNACVLRGGSEALRSNLAIMQCIEEGLLQAGLPKEAVCFIDNTDRAAVSVLLRADDLIDVVIPRGGKGLIQRISNEARVPVIKHLDGVCHVYVDKAANLKQAHAIALNAKTSRYGTCNTMETLLVHQKIAPEFLPRLIADYQQLGVKVKGCAQVLALISELEAASEEDWYSEYLAPILGSCRHSKRQPQYVNFLINKLALVQSNIQKISDRGFCTPKSLILSIVLSYIVLWDLMMWDQRYQQPGFAYGKVPNDFLQAHYQALPLGARVLCIAEGEGRNAVFLAKQGYVVTAVDFSAVGLAKAAAFAKDEGVTITTEVVDLADYDFGVHAWDGVVSIWAHLESKLRRLIHRNIITALKPGGILLLEAYTAEQLTMPSIGGPAAVDATMSLADLTQEFAGLEWIIAKETQRIVNEGHFHQGLSAVVQVLAKKPA